ncbi:MAG: hypothetical protein L3K19_05000 [Thermoplasmata archaeon]|nr:hypothetical protein [Thermoplasmata archaeon]
MGWPASPGPGPYSLTLATPTFYVIVASLALFAAMFWVLREWYPRRRRGLEGYLEAAGVDLVFLSFAVAVVVALVVKDPSGNRTSLALFQVVVGGYWLAFAIPVVTVGSSIHTKSRGGIPWLLPSLAGAVLLFGILFAYYYAVG